MSEETKESIVEEEKEYDFKNLTDRRKYFQDHPELFPKMVQEQLLLRPPYKDGVSWFAYQLAKDVETRHDAHWQLQTFLLWGIWGMMKEFFEGGAKAEKKPIPPSDRVVKEEEQPRATKRRNPITG